METETSDQGCGNESDLQWWISDERPPATNNKEEGGADPIGIAPEPGENLWTPQLGLKNRKPNNGVLSLGVAVQRGGEKLREVGGADSGARQEPPAGLWRGWHALPRGHRGTMSTPRRNSWSEVQPLCPLLASAHGSGGMNSQKLCQALSRGQTPKPWKHKRERQQRDPLFLPTSPHLFRTLGRIRWVEMLRKLLSH